MKNAVVLIDEWNISRSAVQVGHLMSYSLLRSTLEEVLTSDFACDHVEYVIYVGMPPTREDYNDQRQSKMGFVSSLENNGFLVKERAGIPTNQGSYKANVDLMMATDALTCFEDADMFVLATGDGDFSYLVRHLRGRLKEVGVAGLSGSTSNDLRNACSFFIELDQIVKDLMPSAPKEQESTV